MILDAAWKAKKAAQDAAYYLANKEKILQRVAAWAKANPDKRAAIVAAWNKANPDKVSAQRAAYRETHKAQEAAYSAAWQKANPELHCARQARRRARKIAQTPLLTVEQQADIIALYAKARALTELTGEPYHVDHKKPLSKGGLHHPDNLQVLRGIDNLKKGAKLL